MPRYIQPPEPCNKRYTDEDRERILDFVWEWNNEHGSGGIAAAAAEFGPGLSTVYQWLKKAGRGETSWLSPSAEEASIIARMIEICDEMEELDYNVRVAKSERWRLLRELETDAAQ